MNEALRKAVEEGVGVVILKDIRTGTQTVHLTPGMWRDVKDALRDQEAEIAELKRERTLANGWGGDAVVTARTALTNVNEALGIWSDRAKKAEARAEQAEAALAAHLGANHG